MYNLNNVIAYIDAYYEELNNVDRYLVELPKLESETFFSSCGIFKYNLIGVLLRELNKIGIDPKNKVGFLNRINDILQENAGRLELLTLDDLNKIPKLSPILTVGESISPGFQNFCSIAPLSIHPDVIAVAYYFSKLHLLEVNKKHPTLNKEYSELLLNADKTLIESLWSSLDRCSFDNPEQVMLQINAIFENPEQQMEFSTPPPGSTPTSGLSSPRRPGYPEVSVQSQFPTPEKPGRSSVVEEEDTEVIVGAAVGGGYYGEDSWENGEPQRYEYQEQEPELGQQLGFYEYEDQVLDDVPPAAGDAQGLRPSVRRLFSGNTDSSQEEGNDSDADETSKMRM